MIENFVDIILPSDAADSYYLNRKRSYVKDFMYIDNEWFSELLNPDTYFILGSKGSGKTLYAAYMCAETRNDTISKFHTISVDDYGKLIAMKTASRLDYTDYSTMWRVILLQKLLLGLDATEISFLGRTKNYRAIQETISAYFGYDVTDDSFNPMTFIDSNDKQSEVTAYLNSEFGVGTTAIHETLGLKAGNAAKSVEAQGTKTEQVAMVYTDTWLRSIDAFKRTMEKISFKHNHYLFIDGLDVRPTGIDANEYSACIGALVRAVFELNTRILGNMKRKDGHEFKIIALTRTDIFLTSGLVNVTSCIHDNCIELDWSYGNEKDFHYSNLYKMMNHLLGWDGKSSEMPAQRYFGFSLPYPIRRPLKADLYIQRQTRLRPRDIVVLLRLIQKECKSKGLSNPDCSIFDSPELHLHYSNYYTEQVKSEMMFKYSEDDIKSVFQLIKMLNHASFSEEDFFRIYEQHCSKNSEFCNAFPNHRELLNVLYTLDLVGWTEEKRNHMKTHWHYREVKAIDETHQLPWEQFDIASEARLAIHRGASRHVLGYRIK